MDPHATFAAADAALFTALNGATASPWFDHLILAASSPPAFVLPVAAAVTYALARAGRRRFALIVLLGAALIGPLDAGASAVKKSVGRTRPCGAVPAARVVSHCPESPSFPSNHAANAFALAALASAWRRRLALIAFPYAAVIAYSRIHLGVHYPGDVIAAAILGTAYGVVVGAALRGVARSWAAASAQAAAPSPKS